MKCGDITEQPKGLPIRDPDYILDYLKNALHIGTQGQTKPKYVFLSPGNSEYNTDLEPGAIWRGFKAKTTAHGVGHYAQSKGIVKRLYWALVIIAAAATVLFNLTTVARAFFSYYTDYSVTLGHQNSLLFPAVTICNMNPLKRSALEKYKETQIMTKRRKKRSSGTFVCEAGWHEFNGKCYYVHPTPANFDTAESHCTNAGSNLAGVVDSAEDQFIGRLSMPNVNDEVWIGIRKTGWATVWVDGTTVSYANWDSTGLPRFGKCVKIIHGGTWADEDCSIMLRFVCKQVATEITTRLETTATPTSSSGTTITTTTPSTTSSGLSTDESTTSTTDSITTSTLTTTEPITSKHPTSLADTTRFERLSTTNHDTTTFQRVFTTHRDTTAFQWPSTPHDESSTKVPTSATDRTTDRTTDTLPTSSIGKTTMAQTTKAFTTTHKNILTSTQDSTSELTQTRAPKTTNQPSSSPDQTSPIDLQTETTTISSGKSSSYPNVNQKISSQAATSPAVHVTTSVGGCTHSTPGSSEPTTTDHTPSSLSLSHDNSSTPHTSRKVTSCCCTCCKQIGTFNKHQCSTCQNVQLSQAAICAAAMDATVKETTTQSNTPRFFTQRAQNQTVHSKTDELPLPTSVPADHQSESSTETEEFMQYNKIIRYMAEIPKEQKRDMGFSFESLILDCRFSGYSCQDKSFSTFSNPLHGNCYTFNSGWPNTTALRWASRTGRRHGLHMIININQAEYLVSGSDTAGIRLVIHSQDRMPFPEDEGITVSPGRATSVGMRQVRMTHLPHPYGDCYDPQKNNSAINVYEELFPVFYSMQACQKTCYQKNVIEKCGCADPQYPMSGAAFPGISVQLCDSSNKIQEQCKDNVAFKLRQQLLKCSCPDTCNSTVYPLEVSVGQWPSRVLKESILQGLSTGIGDTFDINDPKAYAQNLIKLEIFYEEFNFEMVNERPKSTTGGFFSDVGGVLGLWVGFSIFTVAEIVEVFLDFFMLLVFACLGKRGDGHKMPE